MWVAWCEGGYTNLVGVLFPLKGYVSLSIVEGVIRRVFYSSVLQG